MERRAVYRYAPSQPGSRIVMCRSCHTHIALPQNLIAVNRRTLLGFFGFVVNLEPRNPPHNWKYAGYRMAMVHCVGCNRLLGSRVVHAEVPLLFMLEGVVSIFLNNLLLWDVDTETTLEATTLIPPNNPP